MFKVFYTSIVFLLLDFLWIGYLARGLYFDTLRPFLRLTDNGLQPVILSALFVYIILVAGLLLFPIDKAGGSTKMALVYGFCFGVIVYGTYDFTNHALVNNWPLKVAVIDTIWGGVICAITSAVSVYLTSLRA